MDGMMKILILLLHFLSMGIFFSSDLCILRSKFTDKRKLIFRHAAI